MRDKTGGRSIGSPDTRHLYLDASCLMRVLFAEAGIRVPLGRDITAVSSRLIEVESFRTLDRARLEGFLDDAETARNEVRGTVPTKLRSRPRGGRPGAGLPPE